LTFTSSGRAYTVHLLADARTTSTLVAFVLVATATVLVRRDPRRRALLFVGLGALAAWVVRTLLVLGGLGAGQIGGIALTRVLLGPWADAAAVGVALAVMSSSLRAPVARVAGRDVPWVRAATGRMPRVIAAFAAVAIVVAGVTDVQLDRNDRLTSPLGTPQLVALSSAPTAPTGAELVSRRIVSPVPATVPAHARWTRLRYRTAVDERQSIVDVIDAPSSTSLDDSNVRAWYPVGFRTRAQSTHLRLTDDVDARQLTFRGPRGTWLAITWLWPVAVDGHTRLERVVVMPGAEPTALSAGGNAAPWLGPQQVPAVTAALRRMSERLAQAHLERARIADGPPAVSEG
jgi:hypothetical protein